MVEKFVISHKNPDTDSICASLAYASFLNKKGDSAEAIKLGNLNNETKYVLEKTGIQEPKTNKSLESGSKVILVDHNEKGQSIENIDELELVGIVDHHKVKIESSSPFFIRVEPLGSSCSIVAKIFFENGVDLSEEEAKMLISGIISDTLYFRSPTTTDEDKSIVEELNKIVGIDDLEAYSLEMFDAKSDLGDISSDDLVKLDYKMFDFAGNKFGIGFMETTNPQFGLSRKEELVESLEKIKSEDGLKGVFLSIIDILNGKNLTIVPSEFEEGILSRVFGAEVVEDNVLDLKDRVSRKKQIVPVLENNFN